MTAFYSNHGRFDEAEAFYRELLAQKDVEAVFVTTPLFLHFPITKDALLAGKNVFCEKSLVFRPEEVAALRALKAEHANQVLQTGLQRRYSHFYQMAKDMVDKGVLGNVAAIHCQWHQYPDQARHFRLEWETGRKRSALR